MSEKEPVDVKEKVKQTVTFVRKNAIFFTVLLVLALQFVPNEGGQYPWGGMWMRLETQKLRVAESAAESSLNNAIRSQVAQAANEQYPNLPAPKREEVINDLLNKFREENKEQLDAQRQRLVDQIRGHFMYDVDGESYVYMPDIDPYFYLRYARNVLEKGHWYDEVRDGVPWDNHMSAPIGTRADPNWHPYTMATLHRVLSVFNGKISLMQSATYFPIVFMFLSLILAFLIAHKVSGNLGGFFAVTVLALLPAIIGRTPWGHADTDAYNVFFPLLAVWLLFEALEAKTGKKQMLFGGLAGVAIGVFANFWSAWWFVFDFIGGALAVAIIGELVIHRKALRNGLNEAWEQTKVKKFLIVGVSVFVLAALVVSMTLGASQFINGAFRGPLQAVTLKQAAHPTLWPNVFTTVAELNPSSMSNVIGSMGGTVMFLIGLLGIVFLLLRRNKDGHFDFTYSALLTIWFVGTIYASLKGSRFTLLLGPAFAIAFGVAAGVTYEKLARIAKSQFNVHRAVTGAVIFFLIATVMVGPVGARMVQSSYNSVRGDVPIVNDAWWNSLKTIQDESEPDAIITSWWDFGHHFKFIADRPVTFDGASQNAPQAHWVGRLLQTDDEREAVGILRMLDCGANMAYDTALNATKDPLKSVSLAKEIILLDRDEARGVVQEAGVSEDILELTHCEPPEAFVIASSDMIGKAGVWAHFGLWDFERAEVWSKWRKMGRDEAVPRMAERFEISEERAGELYNEANRLSSEDAANAWISPWPGYAVTSPIGCSQSAGAMRCGSIEINQTTNEGMVHGDAGVAFAGKTVVYGRNGGKAVNENEEGDANIAIVVWPSSGGYQAIAGSAHLADSMFTRLYFMNGLGLEHFEPVTSQNQLIGGMIHTWKVDWQGKDKYVPEGVEPKTEVVEGAQVALNYIGWVEEGVFDSSIPGWKQQNITPETGFDDVRTSPLKFTYGQGQLIPGFERQIKGMKAGETKTITVPPEEAYGTDPSAHPLGNKTLSFKLRVESIE